MNFGYGNFRNLKNLGQLSEEELEEYRASQEQARERGREDARARQVYTQRQREEYNSGKEPRIRGMRY